MPNTVQTAKPAQAPVSRYMAQAGMKEAVAAAQKHLIGLGRPQGLSVEDLKGALGPVVKGQEIAQREGDRLVLTTPRSAERLVASAALEGADVDGNGKVGAQELVAAFYCSKDANRDGRVKIDETTLVTPKQWTHRSQEQLALMVRRERVVLAPERRELKLSEAEEKQLILQELMAAQAAKSAPAPTPTPAAKPKRSIAEQMVAGYMAGQAVGAVLDATSGGKPLGQGHGVSDFLYHASGAAEPRRPFLR